MISSSTSATTSRSPDFHCASRSARAVEQLLLVVSQARCPFEVLRVDRRLLLQADGGNLLVELAKIRRGRHPADPQPRPGLVDQVDGLVGEEAVGDVAVGHLRRRHQGLIGDGDPVVGLVAVTQAAEDVDGVRDRGLGNLDRLEAALQRGVLLDVLPVLVQRRCTDGLQLTAGQHRLEDARRVDRAFGGAGTDEGVDLVDEQDHVAPGLDLLEHLLQPLLEVASVAATRDQSAEVQGVDLFIPEGLGDVAAHNGLRQPFHDRGLADTGLSDKDRIVLRTPGEHGHHPLDFGFPPDDRIQLVLAGGLGQIPTELVEHHRGRRSVSLLRCSGRGRLLTLEATEQLQDLIAHSIQVGTELHQDLGRDTFALSDQTEQDVFGAYVGVVDLQRLAQAQLQDLLGAGSERDVPAGRLLPVPDDFFDLLAYGFQRNPERLESLCGHALTLVNQPKKDVLSPDVVMVQHTGFFLCQYDDTPGPVGKPLEHDGSSSLAVVRLGPPGSDRHHAALTVVVRASDAASPTAGKHLAQPTQAGRALRGGNKPGRLRYNLTTRPPVPADGRTPDPRAVRRVPARSDTGPRSGPLVGTQSRPGRTVVRPGRTCECSSGDADARQTARKRSQDDADATKPVWNRRHTLRREPFRTLLELLPKPAHGS